MNPDGRHAPAPDGPGARGLTRYAAASPSAARELRWLATVLVTAACGGEVTEPTEPVANVIVYESATVTATEDAVLVDGQPRVSFSSSARGYLAQHSIRYENGGPFEPPTDHRFEEAWYMDVARKVVTGERGDTVFVRYLDLGEVTLEGTPARQLTVDTTMVFDSGDGGVRVVESYVLNRILFYSERIETDGSIVTFAHEPSYEGALAGRAVELTGTGSDEVEPFSADLSLQPGARLTSLNSGGPVTFERGQPTVQSDRPLVIGFSRPLERARTVLRIVYLDTPPADQELQRRASAAFELMRTTDRVVIPPSALTKIKSHVPDVDGPFLLRVYEHRQIGDAMRIEHGPSGLGESLSGLQANVLDLYFRMH